VISIKKFKVRAPFDIVQSWFYKQSWNI